VDALRKYLNKIGERQKNLLSPVEQENIHLQFSLKKVSLKKKLLRMYDCLVHIFCFVILIIYNVLIIVYDVESEAQKYY